MTQLQFLKAEIAALAHWAENSGFTNTELSDGEVLDVVVEKLKSFSSGDEVLKMKDINHQKAGADFLEIMNDYMENQHHNPDFDVDSGLHDLYTDLANLYYNLT